MFHNLQQLWNIQYFVTLCIYYILLQQVLIILRKVLYELLYSMPVNFAIFSTTHFSTLHFDTVNHVDLAIEHFATLRNASTEFVYLISPKYTSIHCTTQHFNSLHLKFILSHHHNAVFHT